MSCAKSNSFLRSLAFRLALRHALVFAAFSVAAFWAFYTARRSMLQDQSDSYLLAPAKQCVQAYTHGQPVLQAEMARVADAFGKYDIFLRFLDENGNATMSTAETAWKGLGIDREALASAASGVPVFETVIIQRDYPVRVLYFPVGQGKVLQIAESLREDQRALYEFKILSGAAIALVTLIGAVVSWFTARRALAQVEAVTQTAAKIATGTLDSRVPSTPTADELARLSAAFNHMLDRIQMLLRNLREVTDNLAHELRSPVTRMRGGAETTLTGSENLADYKAMAGSTIEDCDHLLSLINTTLDISEAEAGVVKLRPAEFDLAKVVRDVCDLFRPVAEDKAVEIREETPDGCRVRADREKIQRSLANLLDNAIKYSRAQGSITVTLREAGPDALITVSDTGIGISAEDLPRIFEQLYRSDASRSEPGNGLGLSLARALVRAHGGEISVQSTLGSGSTFTVKLPRSA